MEGGKTIKRLKEKRINDQNEEVEMKKRKQIGNVRRWKAETANETWLARKQEERTTKVRGRRKKRKHKKVYCNNLLIRLIKVTDFAIKVKYKGINRDRCEYKKHNRKINNKTKRIHWIHNGINRTTKENKWGKTNNKLSQKSNGALLYTNVIYAEDSLRIY